ncbi:MAG: TIGR04283 family arsenosugar biosynthesis glycosyltransferase [Chitinophagaceae bacterium]
MISIIIPTYNEADQIEQTISRIQVNKGPHPIEIIVVDGGSNDQTISIAEKCGAITLLSEKKGRAAQMNIGASLAKGEIFYFLHADSLPPENFANHITGAVNKGYSCGCFRLRFDLSHWFLKANCWFTRFNINVVRFGDQSLFVTRDVFNKCGGYNESLQIMEDQEIIHRIKKHGKFKVMNAAVTTSARKYRDNGIFRMQAIFYRIWLLYYLGYPQEQLLRLYQKLIRKS